MQRLMRLPAGHQISSFKAAFLVLVSIREVHGEVRVPNGASSDALYDLVRAETDCMSGQRRLHRLQSRGMSIMVGS